MRRRVVVALGVLVTALAAGCGDRVPAASESTPGAIPSTPSVTQTVSPSESPVPSETTCAPFGSTEDEESSDPLAMSTLTGASMRVGQHDCFERFVFEMAGSGDPPGWSVGYAHPMAADGSGEPVELLGDADLEVVVRVWTVPEFEGRPDEWPPFSGPNELVTTGFTAIRQVRNLYAFEGVTQIGIGLDEERPFRVSWLEGPPRLVVDVATM